MKKLRIIFLLFLFFICGCDKVSFENKIFIYNDSYEYNFISDSIVKYKSKNNNTINCKYTIETNNMIKVICNNDVRLLLYDKDNDCIYDHNSRVYCTNKD